MFARLFSIARNTFTETIRQPIYGVLLLATIFLLIINIFLAGFTLEDDDKLLMDLGLCTILLSGLFLAAFSATGVLTREIENKTAMTIVSKPVTRPVFLLGKYVGLILAQFLAFYICFLVFMLTMHHKVLQNASDPWDWPAIIFGLGFMLVGLVAAAAANYFYGKEFSSTALALVTPLLTVGTIITSFFDREFNPTAFGQGYFHAQNFVAAALLMMALAVVAAVALAVSTRLGQVMTLLTCTVVLIGGFLSDWLFGQYREESVVAAFAYSIIPNMNFFWVVDAAAAGVEVPLQFLVNAGGYAVLYVVAILLVGIALFQRREIG